jgi:hypothetical protein
MEDKNILVRREAKSVAFRSGGRRETAPTDFMSGFTGAVEA